MGVFVRLLRRLGGRGVRVAVLAIGLACTFGGTAIEAQTQARSAAFVEPLIVTNDRGGLLRVRLREIGELRREGRPVEIRGRVCFSTCTLFLGLPDTCISPSTTFGFHGPSSFGFALDPATFDRASKIIARYYPEPLRTWYMETGRHRTAGVYRVRGSDIIAMGIAAC